MTTETKTPIITRITIGNPEDAGTDRFITTDLTNAGAQELANACTAIVTAGIAMGLSPMTLKVGIAPTSAIKASLSAQPATIDTAPTPVPLHVAVLPPVMFADDAPAANKAPDVDPADTVRAGEMDVIGELRSLADLDAARKAGLAPKPTVFRRGLRVNSTGVENARASRLAFEERPTVEEAVASFQGVIADEGRRNHIVRLDSITTADDGSITARSLTGEIELAGVKMEQGVLEQYGNMLAGSVGASGPGRYLSSLTGEWGLALRRQNLDSLLDEFRKVEAGKAAQAKPGAVVDPKTVMLRSRTNGVFALTGRKYPCFDADQVAAAVMEVAKGRGMRAEINYDGHVTSITALAHSTIKPEHYVAGEFFLAGIQVTTRDDGRGAVHVRIILHQNLCLNLIILDLGKTEIKMIRHKGNVAELAKQLRKALGAADKAIQPFLTKWGYACKELVTAETVKPDHGVEMPANLSEDDLLAGVFRNLIQRDLVPVGARKADATIKSLVAAYHADTSGAVFNADGTSRGATRAAIVNAITRVAHTGDFSQAEEEEIQAGGSKLVDAKKYPFAWSPDDKAANEADNGSDVTYAA